MSRMVPYIPITAKVFPMKRQALKNLAEVQIFSDRSDLHHLDDHANRQRGDYHDGFTVSVTVGMCLKTFNIRLTFLNWR